jgi:hypothetical protein
MNEGGRMNQLYVMLAVELVAIVFFVFYARAAHRWDEDERMTGEQERKYLKEYAQRVWKNYPLSKALHYLYCDYQYTLMFARSLNADGRYQKQINDTIRKMQVVGQLMAEANRDEQEERINAAELESSFIVLPNQKSTA